LAQCLRKVERRAARHVFDRLGSYHFIQRDVPYGTNVVHLIFSI